MPRQKRHRDRVYQVVGEPGPGAVFVGYARYSTDMQNPATFVTQHRLMMTHGEGKGWVCGGWYDEPEESGNYEEIEQRPVFRQLLEDAGRVCQVVLCYTNERWARNPA